MLKIRRYQPSDHAAVWELHKTALVAAGAYSPGARDPDLDQIEAVYRQPLPFDVRSTVFCP